jgi:hypothetical protein
VPGGASNIGGSSAGTSTGGYALGGVSNVGGSSAGSNAGGYALGGASNVGGSSAGTSAGGYALGGASNVGGSSAGSNAGGLGNGGTSSAATGGGTQGPPSVLGDSCRFTNVVIVEGASAGDTLLSQYMADALSDACGATMTTRQIHQDAPGVLDASGRPLIGPTELVLMSGGFVTQKAIAYLEQNDTPIYTSITAKKNHYTGFTRAGFQVFSIKDDSFTSGHDVGIIAVTYEPISRTFVLDVYGFNSSGTEAGIFYFANALAPGFNADSNHYYVIEWTDQDGDQSASAGDQYVVLASG